jgi:hypothetical protein
MDFRSSFSLDLFVIVCMMTILQFFVALIEFSPIVHFT